MACQDMGVELVVIIAETRCLHHVDGLYEGCYTVAATVANLQPEMLASLGR